MAATSIAIRVAEEMRCSLGEEVGYSIRFEDVTSAATRIKYLTDGMLLREALMDPLLSRYSVIMVDEAHERSLSTDVLLGILKKIMKRRPELRVIVSSATLQAQDFLRFFAAQDDDGKGGRIISLEGRMYPVDMLFLDSPTEDYVERAVKTVFDIHTQEANGDILVFLTGREEIDTAVQMISEQGEGAHHHQSLLPLPLYAGLPTDQQMYVFEPAPENTRKVIVSTNIGEASVTIDGIVYVIDCGFAKLRAYNPNTGVEALTAVPISKAAATQRAGRAGRTKPGKCFHLYTQQAYEEQMPGTTVPEIQRSNLAPMIMQLKALGIDNIVRFDFLTPPPAELVIRGLELLYSLGAVDDHAKLTKPLGTRMAELATDPMMSKVLLTAPQFNCTSEMLSIAAMVSLQGAVWVQQEEGDTRRKFAVEEGDHLTYLNVYQAFATKGKKDARWCRDNRLNYRSLQRAVSIRSQLKRYLERFGIQEDTTKRVESIEPIQRCLTTGYFAHAAKMQPDGTFKTVSGGLTLYAHPSSLMFVSLPISMSNT